MEGVNIYRKNVERLDENNNVPKFYTFYFNIPNPSIGSIWEQTLDDAIRSSFRTVANLELPYLANHVETIEAIQLQMIERFDVGPLYNQFTENPETIRTLLTHPSDALLTCRKYSIVRQGEQGRKGWRNWIKSLRSGKGAIGIFSPVIASPLYILMPHRLIQKAYHLNTAFADNYKGKNY